MIFKWRGAGAGTKTKYADGRNWVDENNAAYAEAVYPGATAGVADDVLFDAALAAGASSPSTTINATALVALKSFRVSAAYNGTIGSTAADPDGKLKFECTDVYIDATAAGAIYLYGSGAAAGLTNVTVTNGTSVNLDGIITNLKVSKGVVVLASTTNIKTSLTIDYVSSVTADVTMTIPALSNSLPATVTCNGGTINNSNAITTLNLSGASWTQTLGTITTLNVSNSAAFVWIDGNITTLTGTSGAVTATGTNFRRLGTATVSSVFSLNLDNKVNNIVITNYIQVYSGGALTMPNAAKLALYPSTTYAAAAAATYGIKPQTQAAAGEVDGTAIWLQSYEKLDVYYSVGTAGADVVLTIESDTVLTFDVSKADTAQTVTITGAAGDKQGILTIWGYELAAGDKAVRIKSVAGAGTDSWVCAIYVKSTI
jgi:hypothetical protein